MGVVGTRSHVFVFLEAREGGRDEQPSVLVSITKDL